MYRCFPDVCVPLRLHNWQSRCIFPGVLWIKFHISLVELSSDNMRIKWNIYLWWFLEHCIPGIVNRSIVLYFAIWQLTYLTSAVAKAWGFSLLSLLKGILLTILWLLVKMLHMHYKNVWETKRMGEKMTVENCARKAKFCPIRGLEVKLMAL